MSLSRSGGVGDELTTCFVSSCFKSLVAGTLRQHVEACTSADVERRTQGLLNGSCAVVRPTRRTIPWDTAVLMVLEGATPARTMTLGLVNCGCIDAVQPQSSRRR